MAGRGSALARAIGFFREANIDEARVAFQLVEEVIQRRLDEAEAEAHPVKRVVVRKPRRTKAQIAQDKAAMAAHAVQPKQDESQQESLANA